MKRTKRFDEGGDVPEGGRFAKDDSDIYRRAREAVLRQQLDEQFGERPAARRAAPAARATDTGDETARLRRREIMGTPSMSEGVKERLRAQALEPVQPEAMFAPPLRGLNLAARGLSAARAAAPAARAAPAVEPARKATIARPLPKGTNPVKKRAERAERAKSEREGKQGMEAEGGSPAKASPPPPPPPRREPPRDLDEMRMSGEGPGFRKGGSVGASRRADGIAQRGKTRGKFV